MACNILHYAAGFVKTSCSESDRWNIQVCIKVMERNRGQIKLKCRQKVCAWDFGKGPSILIAIVVLKWYIRHLHLKTLKKEGGALAVRTLI